MGRARMARDPIFSHLTARGRAVDPASGRGVHEAATGRRRLGFFAAGLVALTACTDMPAPRPEAPGPDACGASGYQSLIGRPLAAVTLPADLDARTYAEGDPVTMDYRATRLNIVTDDDGTIIEVRCG